MTPSAFTLTVTIDGDEQTIRTFGRVIRNFRYPGLDILCVEVAPLAEPDTKHEQEVQHETVDVG